MNFKHRIFSAIENRNGCGILPMMENGVSQIQVFYRRSKLGSWLLGAMLIQAGTVAATAQIPNDLSRGSIQCLVQPWGEPTNMPSEPYAQVPTATWSMVPGRQSSHWPDNGCSQIFPPLETFSPSSSSGFGPLTQPLTNCPQQIENPATCYPAIQNALISQGPLAPQAMPPNCEPTPAFCGVYGAFEFVWTRAHFDQNVAMIVDPIPGNTLIPFDYNHQLMPRVWLGWQSGNGGGFRATYWQFDATAGTESATAVAGATPVYLFVYGAGGNLSRNAYADLGETLTSTHRLKLQALDLEMTENFRLSSLQVLAGAGVRLASMDQHLRGEVTDSASALEEVVTNDLGFEGIGPTASLQVLRPISASRFSVYSGLRGALLFSDTIQSIFEMKSAGANMVTDVAEQRKVISVGELAIGLQYQQPFGQRAQLFLRSNYECQAWFDAGGPVDSNSTISLDGLALAAGLLF